MLGGHLEVFEILARRSDSKEIIKINVKHRENL
jgi:hypothetical protein